MKSLRAISHLRLVVTTLITVLVLTPALLFSLLAGWPHPSVAADVAPAGQKATNPAADKTKADGVVNTAADLDSLSEKIVRESISGTLAGWSGSPISINLKDADLRDVLSALAINMGVSIILTTDDPPKITFQVRDVQPAQALELLLQSQGLTYLRDGNVIVVGEAGNLEKDFFKQLVLTRFSLSHINAKVAESLIDRLGIPVQSITLETNPHTLWAQGIPQALQKVQDLLVAVDRPENSVAVDSPKNTATEEPSLEYRTISTSRISSARMVELLQEVGLPPERFIVLGNELLVFDQELFGLWEEIDDLIEQLENLQYKEHTLFAYQLRNMLAKDAKSRLETFGFQGVQVLTFNYPEFGRELLVSCPPHLESAVREALTSIDGTRQRIKVPVASARGANAMAELTAKRNLLSELTGVQVARMRISANLSGDANNPHFVLWVDETPDKINQIEELLQRFN